MSIPIHDLHCDLLLFLQEDPTRTPFNPLARCSIPQLLSGPVKRQVMAIFTETGESSSINARAQAHRFAALKKEIPEIHLLAAIENASGLANESESIQTCFDNLNDIMKATGGLVYISLTWNTENRFGGGAHTAIGLKEDGKRLLDFLSGKKIAVDFSHTSDALAYDILSYIDQKGLDILVIASHSNFRAICDVPRNLPDELAKEIFRRKGVIGINFVKKFIGTQIVRHIEHGLKLGGENYLCFGADFYYEGDLSAAYRTDGIPFMEGYDNAGCYQRIISELALPAETWNKIAHANFDRVLLTR